MAIMAYTEVFLEIDSSVSDRLYATNVISRSGNQLLALISDILDVSELEAGRAAWKEGVPFSVVLMDMQMPVMDGYEATLKLRECGYDRQIIALTAHAIPDEKRAR